MKPAVSSFLTLAVALLGLSLTGVAGASAMQASRTAQKQQAYLIDVGLDRTELKVKVSALSSDETRAEARITPCLSKALVPLFEKVDANPSTGNYRALELLSAEAGAEYQDASIKPVVNPLLNGARRLLKLSLPAAERAQLEIFLPAYMSLQSLNVCADARAWNAADLAPGKEPEGTARAVKALDAIGKLATSVGKPDLGGLTPAQVHSAKDLKKRADDHAKALIKQSDAALKSWIAKLTRSVETVVATQTSTTPATTTTGTTTAPATTTSTASG